MDKHFDINDFVDEQIENWPLAANNYTGLKKVKLRELVFDDVTIKIQFNPERIRSSAAKVDKQSIKERACFLCENNRPKEQKETRFNKYSILVNPFPIFPLHLTIVEENHVPQEIATRIMDMLDLSDVLPDYTIFYNGPECGASAPDHFHFQAGNKGFMPIEKELDKLIENQSSLLLNKQIKFWAIQDGLRNFFVLESADKQLIVSELERIYQNLKAGKLYKEPMLNILCWKENDKFKLLVFPRALHRPKQYYEEGEGNILLSPASVDMGGALITPLEKDFENISKEDIEDIFAQVLLNDLEFNGLIRKLS